MSQLTRLALETLQDPSSPHGLRSTACSTLMHAIDLGVLVPVKSPLACWQFLLESEASAHSLNQHRLQDPEVARDAVRLLLDQNSSTGVQDLALSVLQDQNLHAITEQDLATILERVMTESRARMVGWLIDRIHEERGLSNESLIRIRNRFASSNVAAVRAQGPAVSALLPRLDQEFAIRILQDPAPAVRSAVLEMLHTVEPLDAPQALLLVQAHLATEQHRNVISSCHLAAGHLMRAVRRAGRESDVASAGEH